LSISSFVSFGRLGWEFGRILVSLPFNKSVNVRSVYFSVWLGHVWTPLANFCQKLCKILPAWQWLILILSFPRLPPPTRYLLWLHILLV
jgi:hypothetical protein